MTNTLTWTGAASTDWATAGNWDLGVVPGATRIVEELERQLGIKAGQTTADKQFTLETLNCLGACALGPVVVIDGHYFSKVKKSRISQLLDEAGKGFAVVASEVKSLAIQTAKATEETAQNTKKLVTETRVGGLTFS